jgi:hypothetical protein
LPRLVDADVPPQSAASHLFFPSTLLGFAFCRGVTFETLALGFGGGLAPAVLLRYQLRFLFLSAALILRAMCFGFHPALAFLVRPFQGFGFFLTAAFLRRHPRLEKRLDNILAEILYLFPPHRTRPRHAAEFWSSRHTRRHRVRPASRARAPAGMVSVACPGLTDVDYLQDVILATLVFEPERRDPDVEDWKNQVLTTKFCFTRD